MRIRQKNIPTGERYAQDVAGMPCFAAAAPFAVFIGAESMASAIPKDDEHCAIAEGCRVQLRTPYVSVGRSRTEIAFPHPDGVAKPGFRGKWAVIRWKNTDDACRIVEAADTGALDDLWPDGALVKLIPYGPADTPSGKRARNRRFRKDKGRYPSSRGLSGGTGEDRLTAMGVRKLTGQRHR